jgi:hypothetical protein
MVDQPVLEKQQQDVLGYGFAVVSHCAERNYPLSKPSVLLDMIVCVVMLCGVVAIAVDQFLFRLKMIDGVGEEISGYLFKESIIWMCGDLRLDTDQRIHQYSVLSIDLVYPSKQRVVPFESFIGAHWKTPFAR